MPRKLRQIAAVVAAAGTLATGCVIAEASQPDDAGLIASPPTVCTVTHYGYEMTCREANVLRLVVTIRWLRHYAWLAAAARYATAVHRAQTSAATSVPSYPWDQLAQCESGGNWSINTGNGFYGGIQFTLQSWQAVGGVGYPHRASREEQIRRGQALQAIQGWGAWPACSARLGLR